MSDFLAVDERVGSVSTAGADRRGRVSPVLVFAWLVLACVAFCAIFGSLIAPHAPLDQDLLSSLVGPRSSHLLGTDDLGRDTFSRLVVGARSATVGPLVIVFGSMIAGSVLGVVAGYRGGFVDAAIMRWADLMFALPGLLVAIVVVGVLGGGYFRAVILLVILYCPLDARLVRAATLTALFTPYDARIVRGATLEQRSRAYVEAARTLGLSSTRIMFRHIWPNLLPIIVSKGALTFGLALVNLSALSFLGLGAGPQSADWGRMLADSLSTLFGNPLTAIAPGVALVLTAACINLVGDSLFETLSHRGRAR
jgi:peptide/nickel transport system permease protein